MSTDQATTNKATLTRFQEALSSGDWELISKTIDEVVEPDALIRTPLPIEATGAELRNEVFGRLHRAFPDLQITIEDMIAEADKVVARDTVTGTHQGEYMGLPPPLRKQPTALQGILGGDVAGDPRVSASGHGGAQPARPSTPDRFRGSRGRVALVLRRAG
jgi:predicted ester cyclase